MQIIIPKTPQKAVTKAHQWSDNKASSSFSGGECEYNREALGLGSAWEILVSLQQLGKNVSACKILNYHSFYFGLHLSTAGLQQKKWLFGSLKKELVKRTKQAPFSILIYIKKK